MVENKNEEKGIADSQGILDLLKKMQCKIDSMEEKLDSLVRQSKEKAFSGKQYSRSHKGYDKPWRPKVGRHEEKKDEGSSEGKFFHGRPFGMKKDTGKSDFKKSRKSFSKTKKSTRGTSK